MACLPCQKKKEEALKKLAEVKEKAGIANSPQTSQSKDTRTGGFFK